MQNYNEGFVGMIQGDCCPASVVRQAAEDAANLCTMTYGEAPEVEIIDGESCKFKYMPSDLHYMLVELLKVRCELHRASFWLVVLDKAFFSCYWAARSFRSIWCDTSFTRCGCSTAPSFCVCMFSLPSDFRAHLIVVSADTAVSWVSLRGIALEELPGAHNLGWTSSWRRLFS